MTNLAATKFGPVGFYQGVDQAFLFGLLELLRQELLRSLAAVFQVIFRKI